jgi:hypothetical protein
MICPDVKAPAALRQYRSVRYDLGGEQTWRPEHYEISAASKDHPTRSRDSWDRRGKPTHSVLGKADDIVEGTGESTRCTAGVGDPASKERLSEIASGSSRGQQGLRNNLQRLLERG